jgi:glucosyl-3-phosphoglycerate synthase
VISVCVADGAALDAPITVVSARGAQRHDPATLLPELGPLLGRGDLLWRALSVLDGDLVCFVEAAPDACGLLAPLVGDRVLQFVAGARPGDGGRVAALTAQPLLDAFYPELASTLQRPFPTAFAARRELLDTLAFSTGHGVTIGLLLDVWLRAGPAVIAEVELAACPRALPPLEAEAPVAADVLAAVTRRLRRDGRLAHDAAAQAAGLRGPSIATARRAREPSRGPACRA